MATRGVHFAITDEQAALLLEADDDEAIMGVIEGIEETWDRDNLAESDKAWDAMHRCLTGELEYGAGEYPLSLCVLGPRQLHEGEDYIVCLALPAEVRDVAKALEPISAEWFKEQYRTRVPKDYAPEYGVEDQEYTWSGFEQVRDLFQKAAQRGRAVVFTASQ